MDLNTSWTVLVIGVILFLIIGMISVYVFTRDCGPSPTPSPSPAPAPAPSPYPVFAPAPASGPLYYVPQ